MQIISVNGIKIVPQQMLASGVQDVVAVNPAEQNTGQNAFIFQAFRRKGDFRTDTLGQGIGTTQTVSSS